MFAYESRRENHNGKNTREAREVATRVLGKSLPDSAEIHHVDGNPGNNDNSNLVICENHSYHKMLHARTDAFLACGNANWKPCWICGEYCDKNNLVPMGTRGFQHPECFALYMRMRRHYSKQGFSTAGIAELIRKCLHKINLKSSSCTSAL